MLAAGVQALLPAGFSPVSALALVLSAGFTSALTAGMGLGGGVLLLGIMSLLVSPAALIPLHGVVQVGSNIGRTWLMRRYIAPAIVLPFVVGALAGTWAGGSLSRALPPHLLDAILAAFILYAVWGRWPALHGRARTTGLWVGGVTISGLSMFVGATGPLVSTLMKTQALDRQRHMATFSACMSLQHVLKVIVFGWFGFTFGAWLPLLTAMVLCGFAGTWLGERWLAGRSDDSFRRSLDWVLTAMALQLAWRALAG